jgi:hypothetical protein
MCVGQENGTGAISNKEETMAANDALYITVATLPQGYGFHENVSMLKGALLLADKVWLAGLEQALLYGSLKRLERSLSDSKVSLDQGLGELLGFMQLMTAYNIPSEKAYDMMLRDVTDVLGAYNSKLVLPFPISITKEDMGTLMRHAPKQEGDADGSIKFLEATQDMLTREYLRQISTAIVNGSTYPLMDKGIAEMVADTAGAKRRSGNSSQPTNSVNHISKYAKPVLLGTNLFRKLPLFEQATTGELLDIRKELSEPLVRLRGALVEMSEQIKSAPWDDDFPQDVELLVRRNIEPAILDLDERVKSNIYLERLSRKLLTEPIEPAKGSIIGMALGNIVSLSPQLAVLAGLGMGAVVLGSQIYNEWVTEKKELGHHQLYFYYEARRRLSPKSRRHMKSRIRWRRSMSN